MALKKCFTIDSKEMYLVLFPSTPILSSVSIFVALPPPDEVLFTHLTPLAWLFKNAWTINKDVFFFPSP